MTSLNYAGMLGSYCSRTLMTDNPDNAYVLMLTSSGFNTANGPRAIGFTVRPVRNQ